MELEKISATLDEVKKFTLIKQNLTGNSPSGDFSDKITAIIRDVGYIQWDPVTVVAPSHLISIWSRIGKFKWSDLDRVMFEEKKAFLHWTPIAWIVLLEDFPIYNSLMSRFPESMRKGWSSTVDRAKKFLVHNSRLREVVLERLKKGPAATGELSSYGNRIENNDGWGSRNEVMDLLFYLHMEGRVMVSGHSGNENIWALSEDYLPESADSTLFSVSDLEKMTAIRSLKALGVANQPEIYRYFVRGRYTNIGEALDSLVNEGRIIKITLEERPKEKVNYILKEDKPKLDLIMSGKWRPALNLISPFDNLITLRDRIKRLFNFEYTLEQFVPRDKRKFGTYVLPIVWDRNIVGRLDAKLDKANGVLKVNSVYSEVGFEDILEIGEQLSTKIDEFRSFLNAEKVVFGEKIPRGWARYLC